MHSLPGKEAIYKPFSCAQFAGVYVHGLPDFSDKCLINLILGYLPCRIARLSDNSCTWIIEEAGSALQASDALPIITIN